MKDDVHSLVFDNKKLNAEEKIAYNYLGARIISNSNAIEQPEDQYSTRPVF